MLSRTWLAGAAAVAILATPTAHSERGSQRFEGRSLSCAIAVLGYPDGTRTKGKTQVYDWREKKPSASRLGRGCRLTLAIDKDGFVTAADSYGNTQACGVDAGLPGRLSAEPECDARQAAPRRAQDTSGRRQRR